MKDAVFWDVTLLCRWSY